MVQGRKQAQGIEPSAKDTVLQGVESLLQQQLEQDEPTDNNPSSVTRDGVQVFPVDACFNNQIIEYIQNVADVANSSVSSVALSCLSAYSTAMCGKRWAVLRGDDGNVKYNVEPIIYTCFVARATGGKTQTLSIPTKPLKESDERLYNEWKADTKTALENSKEPTPLKRHILRNATPEYAVAQMYNNCDEHGNPTIGCMMYNDELSCFLQKAKNYKGDGYIELLLHSFDGETHDKGRLSTDFISLKKMHLSVSFALQERNVKKCLSSDMVDNGLLQRIMWVFDDANEKYISRNGLKPTLEKYWFNAVNDVEHLEPKQLEFTEDARQLFFEWCDNCKDFSNEQDNTILSEFVNKHSYFVLRLSLIFATMHKQDEITHENVAAAIRCCNYFLYTDTLLLGYMQYGENIGESTMPSLVYKFLKKVVAPGTELSETALSKLIGRASNYITKNRQRYEQQHNINSNEKGLQ